MAKPNLLYDQNQCNKHNGITWFMVRIWVKVPDIILTNQIHETR